MDKLCKYIDKELDELENKVGMGGKLSRADIEDGKNLAKFKMAILTNEAMENNGEYSNDYMQGGNSYGYNRGASYRGRRRDSMGRYSRDEANDEIISRLHEVMEEAPNEQTKQEIRKLINKMENM